VGFPGGQCGATGDDTGIADPQLRANTRVGRSPWCGGAVNRDGGGVPRGTRCGAPRGDTGVGDPPLGANPMRGEPAGWSRAPWRGGAPNSDGECLWGGA
jgi:hypothetical protein